MAKVRLKATKLENAKVQFISLVDRGANRIPFRIVKREHDMIDLTNMFKRGEQVSKKETKPSAPELYSLIISSGEHEADVGSFFEQAGFATDRIKKNEDDGYLSYDQKEYAKEEIEGLSVIKVDDGVVLLMKEDRVSKAAEGTIFDLQDEFGFYPSPENALNGLSQHVFEAVTKAETKEEAQVLVAKHLADCAEFLSAYIDVVPDAIRKGSIESLVAKHEKPAAEQPQEVNNEQQEAPVVKSEASSEEPSAESSEQEAVAQESKTVKQEVEEHFASYMDGFSKKIEGMLTGLSGQVTSLKSDIDALQKDHQTVSLKLESVDAVAKSAANAVKGTLIAAPVGGDPAPKGVQKSDSSAGTFDTAFLPKRRLF